jgi:hypothetical protein
MFFEDIYLRITFGCLGNHYYCNYYKGNKLLLGFMINIISYTNV